MNDPKKPSPEQEAEAKAKLDAEAKAKAEAEAAANAKAAAERERASLVSMKKGDETLDVHPTCVAAHKSAGWKLAQ